MTQNGLSATTNPQIKPYADYVFSSSGGTTSETLQGAGPSSPTNLRSAGTFTFSSSVNTTASSSGAPTGVNAWYYSTTESFPNMTTETIYSNYAGQVMLTSETVDPNTYYTYTKYDSQGRPIVVAGPSAVQSADPTDLGVGKLKPTDGLITTIDYYTSGDSAGYVHHTYLNHGGNSIQSPNSDNQILQQTLDYVTQKGSNFTIVVNSKETDYQTSDGANPLETTTSYDFDKGSLQPTKETITPPKVIAPQHGTGNATPTVYTYDAYGRVATITDPKGVVTTNTYDDNSGVLTDTVTGSSPSLETKTTNWDGLGRPLTVVDPNGNTIQYGYKDTQTISEVDVLPAGGAPMQAVISNLAFGVIDSVSFSGASISNGARSGGTVESATRQFVDYGGRVVKVDRYFNKDANFNPDVAGAFGAVNSAYYESTVTYDFKMLTTSDAMGTVVVTDLDSLGRAIDKKMGGTTVETIQYDGGLAGDGNVTQVTDFPGPDGNGGTLPNRVSTNYYDWRNRVIASDNGISLSYSTIDNVGEVTQQDVYASAQAALPAFSGATGFAGGNPVPVGNAGALRQRTQYDYDDDGENYRTTVVGVDPATGATSGSIVSNSYFDNDGRVIASSSPGGLWTKTTYDDAGKPKTAYYTDNAGGDPTQTSGDNIFTQVDYTYDNNSNTTKTVTTDRSFGGTTPPSRVSTVEYKYDADNRLYETDNDGTGAGPALVTKQTYDSKSGFLKTVTDPSNTVTAYGNDMLGRHVTETDNSTGAGGSVDSNKATNYIFNAADEVTSMTVLNYFAAGANRQAEPQTTTYGYGTTGSLDKSKQSVIHYTDGTTQSWLYDYLGEPVKQTNQDGTQHHYSYDALGRLTSDYANNFGPGVDTTVQKLSTQYDVLGRPVMMTSEGHIPGQAYGNLNQVQNIYDSFGNLKEQDQQGGGSISTNGTGAAVQYFYDSSNPTRLDHMTYPDGRNEYYTYSSGPDANIGRVTSINDPDAGNARGTAIESYSYLGLSIVVGKSRGQAGTSLAETLSLDPYGRLSSVQWSASGAATDSFSYTYDNASNLKSAVNNVNSYASESYGYDGLNRQTSFKRGPVTGGVSDGSVVNASWTVDTAGNKFGDKYGNNYAGQDHKDGNHDQAGNQSIVSLPAGLVNLTYDAWGRVVTATDSYTVADIPFTDTTSYSYDALGRQISQRVNTHVGTPTAATTVNRLFYNGQNVIEERSGQTGKVTAQYVWAAGPNALVLRDSQTTPGSPGTSSVIPQISGSPLNQRLYAQDNGLGSITSITAIGGNVVERYLYDQDGQPRAVTSTWGAWSDGSTTLQVDDSRYNWVYLWHGGRRTLYEVRPQSGERYQYGSRRRVDGGGGIVLLLAGGMSWGDPPTELFEAMSRLHEASVLPDARREQS